MKKGKGADDEGIVARKSKQRLPTSSMQSYGAMRSYHHTGKSNKIVVLFKKGDKQMPEN